MDRLKERVRRTATCPHPWGSLRFGIAGMICTACTGTWETTPGTRAIQQAGTFESDNGS